MSARPTLGIVLSAAAVAAVGALGVWLGLAATAVPNVDLGATVNDTVVVSTGTEDAGITAEWRLHRDGHVSITVGMAASGIAIPEDFPTATHAQIAVELWCDTRLKNLDPPAGVQLIDDGDESACSDPTDDGVGARQIFVMDVAFDELVVITGQPVRSWSTTLAGQSTARSPRMILYAGGLYDPVMPFAGVTPGKYSTLGAVLESGPQDLLDLTVTPSGETVESTSVMVQGDGTDVWVDSAAWLLTFSGDLSGQTTMEEGLARWTDPAGQTFTQLLLLLSGAFIGVAASLAVERLYFWTLHLRRSGTGNAEGAPPEGDAPVV